MLHISGIGARLASELSTILACENFRTMDAQQMKISQAISIGTIIFCSTQFVSAREAALRYHFTAGQTNVFAVEISVRSENGSDISSGNIILVTKSVTTNSVILGCRGNLKSETKRTPGRERGFYPGMFPGGMMQNVIVFPYDCEIELDGQGNEVRDGGDYVMAVPLGKLVQSLFTPLPEKSRMESRDKVSVLDDPFWLGPADNFQNVRQNGQPMGMNFMFMNGQRNPMATLLAWRDSSSQLKTSTNELMELHQEYQLESLAQNNGGPRLKATSSSESTFDRAQGWLSRIETEADVCSQTETTSRHAKVSFKARLLTGDELAATLAPPPPPAPPRQLSGAELDHIIADLKSPEWETRRGAVRQLNGADIDSPSPELLDEVGALALDSDAYVRMTGANFICNHATTNQVPVLLKLLKGSDWSVRQPVLKALGRLNDARAAQPLADLLARNGNMFSQDISSALINLGTPAEKPALGLLNERSLDVQRQACAILQQIGTSESLDALQKLVADEDQTVSQAAADAIRAIKQRQ
jgi:hypothetical protein